MFLDSFCTHFLGSLVVYSSESLILGVFNFCTFLWSVEVRMMFSLARLLYCPLKLLYVSTLLENTEMCCWLCLALKVDGSIKGKLQPPK